MFIMPFLRPAAFFVLSITTLSMLQIIEKKNLAIEFGSEFSCILKLFYTKKYGVEKIELKIVEVHVTSYWHKK